MGSLVQLTERQDVLTVATCPPVLVNGTWKLPLLLPPMTSDTEVTLMARVREARERLGLEARRG